MNPKEQHILDELKKAPATLPPDDYFQQLKTGILSQLPETKIVPLYKRWWAIGSAAASVILLLSLLLLKEETTPQQASPDWSSVSKEEVLAYIEDNIDDFEPETLAQHLTDIPEWHETVSTGDTTAISFNINTPDKKASEDLFDDLEHKEILEYLQNEAIDIDDELLIGS